MYLSFDIYSWVLSLINVGEYQKELVVLMILSPVFEINAHELTQGYLQNRKIFSSLSCDPNQEVKTLTNEDLEIPNDS